MDEAHINVNGKTYKQSELTQQQIVYSNHIINLTQRIDALTFELDQLMAARAHFLGQLETSLDKK